MNAKNILGTPAIPQNLMKITTLTEQPQGASSNSDPYRLQLLFEGLHFSGCISNTGDPA
jgi:hypothetical protein